MGGRHHSRTLNQNVYGKLNPKTKKLVKIIKGTCSNCGCIKSQILTKSMTRKGNFIKKGKCKSNYCSSMSNSACCDLNKKCTVLKLHDMCHNPKCNYQKQIAFTPKQFQLEGAGF